MKKWTYFADMVRQVEMRTTDDGSFIGYNYKGAGVTWERPRRELDKKEFFDSVEDAVSTLRNRFGIRVSHLNFVVEELAKYVASLGREAAHLERLMYDIPVEKSDA